MDSFSFQIPVLSTLVGYLAEWMRIGLGFGYDMTVSMGYPSYGIAIIVLTVIIKTILLPFAWKQIHSMKGMQELQPKVQALRKKYAKDRVRLNEEMRKLYAESGVSPLAGCLPLLVQMPFLVAIFYALQGFPYDPQYESFLWIDSLAMPDGTYTLPILAALSTYLVTWQTTPSNAEGNQKMMSYLMPAFIGYIAITFPSGLVIYWVICNVYQMVQQLLMFPKETLAKLTGKKEESGVVTVRSVPRKDEGETPRKKKIVRKKIIKKVAKKPDSDSSASEKSKEAASSSSQSDGEAVEK